MAQILDFAAYRRKNSGKLLLKKLEKKFPNTRSVGCQSCDASGFVRLYGQWFMPAPVDDGNPRDICPHCSGMGVILETIIKGEEEHG